jgi:hypothetical protein
VQPGHPSPLPESGVNRKRQFDRIVKFRGLVTHHPIRQRAESDGDQRDVSCYDTR